MKIIARKLRSKGSNYGWSVGAAWLDYCHPPYPSGPEPLGWASFGAARIYNTTEGFLAVSFGCHWERSQRAWSPSWRACQTVEEAMDFCESDMVRNGTLPELEKALDRKFIWELK